MNNKSNEPFHPFLSNTPEDEAKAKQYQLGFNDGLRIGLDKGILMVNEFLNEYLHSVVGEAKIIELREKVKQRFEEG